MMDDDLKGAFRELRASDAERAPALDALLQRKGKRGVHALFVLVPSFAVLASAAAIVLWVNSAPAPRAAAPAVAASVAIVPFESEPLGFLLETPSAGVLDFDSDPRGPR